MPHLDRSTAPVPAPPRGAPVRRASVERAPWTPAPVRRDPDRVGAALLLCAPSARRAGKGPATPPADGVGALLAAAWVVCRAAVRAWAGSVLAGWAALERGFGGPQPVVVALGAARAREPRRPTDPPPAIRDSVGAPPSTPAPHRRAAA